MQQVAVKKKKDIFKTFVTRNSFGHYFSLQNQPNRGKAIAFEKCCAAFSAVYSASSLRSIRLPSTPLTAEQRVLCPE